MAGKGRARPAPAHAPLPCPCCGSSEVLVQVVSRPASPPVPHVECRDCGLRGPELKGGPGDNYDHPVCLAVAAWNRLALAVARGRAGVRRG